MGKKGNWFSAIKRVFTSQSKEKLGNESETNPTKEKKKKGFGKLRRGETNSFLPLFREPSSIEKILGDAENEHNLIFRPPLSPDRRKPSTSQPPLRLASPPRVSSQRFTSPVVPSPRPTSPRAISPRAVSPRTVSPRTVSPRATPQRAPTPKAPSPRVVQWHKEIAFRPEPTLANQHASATRIQAAFRGYMARRSFRALKGLVRLQGLVKGQSVKRQTINAMKYMQHLVRVQTQIQSRRIQMLENQARRQAHYRNDKEERESTMGKWTASEAGNGEWDDSLLTKEEKEARLQRKVDAIVKRERSMAYAYSHQLWKDTPKSTLSDISSCGFPLWWNWMDRQLPLPINPPSSQSRTIKDFRVTPPRPSHLRFDNNFDTPTPKSSKSNVFTPTRPIRTPQSQNNFRGLSKYSRGRTESPFKDDDSLTSCPPFSVPSYMTPTVSAKAKVRASSHPKERVMGTPGSSSGDKRRLSFPLTQAIGSFKWNKGSLFSSNNNNNDDDNKGSSSSGLAVPKKPQSLQPVENLSVDSAVSMPAAVGRKPFNRFV